MTIKAYLWGMRLCTLVAFVSLVLVINFVDPKRDGLIGQLLFYASVFFSVTGIAALFLFWLRRKFSNFEIVDANAGISLRQGALVAFTLVALLILQSFRLLVWWDGGIVIAGILLIELWFLSR